MSSPPPQNSNERTTIPQSQSTIVSSVFQVRERIHNALSGSNAIFLGPLSWVLTLQIFAISLIWWISTLPIRISIDIYDRHIRAMFPQLPSIRNLLLTIRTNMASIFTSLPKQGGALPSIRNLLLTTRTAMVSIFTSFLKKGGATTPSPQPQGGGGSNARRRTLPVDLNNLPADGS